MTTPLQIIARAIREARMANGLLAAGWLSEHEVDIVARAVLADLAAEGLAPPVWQPIEMAPRVSRHALLFGDGPGVLQCAFVGGWRHGAWVKIGGDMAMAPTHWMPLPAAPSTPTDGAQG